MGKEELSRAEQYRKERKERLAKEAKKNSKRNAAVAKAKSTVLKICAIVVAAAIVFGICVAAFNAAGSTIFRSKVATVGDNKISSVEFSYYYRTIYNFYYQYASQGYDLGFDATISPDEQKYTADDETTTAAESEESETEEGETTSETTTTNYDTWNDFFIDTALNQIKNNYMLNAAAAKEGVKLEESDIKAVDDQIETMETTAKENGYTLNAYIKATYGSNLNSTLLREFLLKDALSQKYTEYKQDEYAASYSNDKVLEEYNNNKTDYDYVDYRAQVFNVSDDQDAAATKALAEDFLAKATSSDAFEAAADEIAIADAVKTAKESASESGEEVDEEVVASEYTDADNTLKEKTKYSDFYSNQEIADWLFNTAKTGDVKLFELKTDDSITSYNVVFCVKAAYKDESSTVNVRHILFKFNEDNTDPTDEQKAVAKQKAEEAYNEWKNGDMTEDSFAANATEKSEYTGSAANGGLYEDVTEGQMVTAFNDWIFDSARKTGDTDIVETEYGYHVIYFVSKSDTPVWEQTIRDALAQDDYTEYLNEMSESAEYEIEENDLALKMVSKKVNKSIKRYIYNVSRNSAADTAS